MLKLASQIRTLRIENGSKVDKIIIESTSLPEETTAVTLLQTHVSFLFLTDNFAYKIKKPVNLGFLDFTSLDRRRFYCEEEVRLNRRLCPDIYLDVVEIRETPNGAIIDGEGKVIDYAVKMKKLPEERMLSRLLEENKVSISDMSVIATTIATFHRTAERSPEIDSYGDIESITYNCEENFRQLTQFIGLTLSRDELLLISSWMKSFLDNNRKLFATRVAEGFIRECDGDMHSGNICITDKVCIFDCIEFNKRFRCCDTAADLAFLLMDFDFHRKTVLGRVLLDEYRKASGDQGLLAVIDFYKIYRAVVRCKVESFRLKDPAIPDTEKELARQRARMYLRLARGYILRQQLKPTLFITCGLMGSGKSAFATTLAFELGMETAMADAVRKEIAGSVIHDSSDYGKGLYTPKFNNATYKTLLSRSKHALASGQSIIVDATFRRKSDRSCFRKCAAEMGADFVILWLDCPEKIIRQRLELREKDPLAVSDGRWELFHRQKEEFQPLSIDEGKTIVIDSSRPLLDNVDYLLKQLEFS